MAVQAVASKELRLYSGNSIALTLDASQNATFAGSVTATTGTFSESTGGSSFVMSITDSNDNQPLEVIGTRTDGNGPMISLYHNGGEDQANDADSSSIRFYFKNDRNGGATNEKILFAQMQGLANDVTDGTEDGALVFKTIANGSEITQLTLDTTSGAARATFAGDVTINKDAARLILQDTGTGNALNQWVSYRDSAGTERGYVGYGSTGNSVFYIQNTLSEIHFHTSSGLCQTLAGTATTFAGNFHTTARAAVGTTPHATIKLDVLGTATDWTARVKNYTNGGYGLAVDCSGADSSTTYALAVYDAASLGNFFVRNDGNVGIGINPLARFHVKTASNVNFTTTNSGAALRLNAVNDAVDTAVPLEFNASYYNFLGTGTSYFAGQIQTSAANGIGRDTHNYITFATDDTIIYRIADSHKFKMITDAFAPYADSSYDLGTSSLYFRHGYIDAITTTGDATIGGTVDAVTIGSNTAALRGTSLTIDSRLTLHDGEIDCGSGDLTLDSVGDIILDADGGDWIFSDAGTTILGVHNVSNNAVLKANVNDADMIFKGTDNNSEITALTLDMSNGGSATFRDDIDYGGKLTQTGTSTNTFAGALDIRGTGYNQIKIATNLTADTNKQSGIITENYEGNNVSIFQTFQQNNSNAIYYGSADGAYAGIQTHYFMVNADSDTAGSGHTTALTIASNTNATFAGDVTSNSGFYPDANDGAELGNASLGFSAGHMGELHIDDYIYHKGDTNTYIYFTPDVQTFRTGGGDRLVINQYGLGIGGAACAGYILEAEGTGHQRFNIRSSDNTTSGVFFQVKNSGNSTGRGTIATQNDGDMHFFTGTTGDAVAMELRANQTAYFYNSVYLSSSGVGVLSWTGSAGNSVGNAVVMGGESGYGISFRAGASERATMATNGNMTFSGNISNTSGQILPNELSMGDGKKIMLGNGDDF